MLSPFPYKNTFCKLVCSSFLALAEITTKQGLNLTALTTSWQSWDSWEAYRLPTLGCEGHDAAWSTQQKHLFTNPPQSVRNLIAAWTRRKLLASMPLRRQLGLRNNPSQDTDSKIRSWCGIYCLAAWQDTGRAYYWYYITSHIRLLCQDIPSNYFLQWFVSHRSTWVLYYRAYYISPLQTGS